MAAFVESDELAKYEHLLSGSIFSKKETETLREALKKAIFKSMAGVGDDMLKSLLAHITKQINSRRIVPGAGTVGANIYTGNRRLNDGLDSVRRVNNALTIQHLRFQRMMGTPVDNRPRGLSTVTEGLMRDPGLYTGNDFDYLREQERSQQEARERARLELARQGRERQERAAALNLAILRIRHPQRAHEEELRTRFGNAGANAILGEEMQARARERERIERERIQRVKSRFEDAMYDLGLSDNRREFKNLQEQFGGGEEGHKRAEQYIAKRKEREARREELLYKKQHPLLSKISKNMPKIDKSLTGLSKGLMKIPGGGLLNKIGMGSPISGAAMLAYAAIISGARRANEASVKVTSMENMQDIYGRASGKFTRAALLAGIKDQGEITKMFGRANLEYGDAEQFYTVMGQSLLAAKDPRARAAILQSMQWDETQGNLAMLLAGGKVSTNRRTTMARSLADINDDLAWESAKRGNPLGTLQALWYMIPGMKDVQAFDAGYTDYVFEGLQEDNQYWLDKVLPETKSAAESADNYEASGQTNIRNGDINVSVHVDRLEDGYDLASRIEAGLGSSALRDAYEQRKNGMRA